MVEREKMTKKYRHTGVAGKVYMVVTTLDGWVAEASMKALVGIEALHRRAGLEGAFPGPRAAMGAALLKQQTQCYAHWLAAETGAAVVAAGRGALRDVAALTLQFGAST